MGLRKKALLCGLVTATLGLLGFILGIVAYVVAENMSNLSVVYTDNYNFVQNLGYCYYPSNSATGLAITAGILIVAAEMVASIAACVDCCSRRPAPRNAGAMACGIVCLVVSWVVGLPATALLILGAYVFSPAVHISISYVQESDVVCDFSNRKWVLLAGSLLSLVATGLALASYPLITSTSSSSSPTTHDTRKHSPADHAEMTRV